MAIAAPTYSLQGQLFEVCSCGTLCPCWIGEDPDTGVCDAFAGWHVEQGQIQGVDVSGHTILFVAHIPGNVFAGNWRVVIYMDDKATPAQRDALLSVFTGKLGGGIADLAQLVGEVLDVRTAPIEYQVHEGAGIIKIGDVLYGEMQPYKGPDGQPTKLVDSVFSTIPGSPAYVSKASRSMVNLPEFGMTWEFHGRNAIQGLFKLEA